MLLIALSSCTKDKAAPRDTTAPTFNMVQPGAGDMFSNGDTIWIQVWYYDDVELRETGVRVFKNGIQVMKHFDISSDTMHVHGHHVNIDVSSQTEFRVRAEAKDAAGNTADMERIYVVNP